MEHAVHIASGHFVAAVAPTPPKPLHKKIRELLDEACNKGDIDAADVAKVLATLDGGGDEDPEASPADSEWTVGDAVGKILAFIKQVWCINLLFAQILICVTGSHVSPSPRFLQEMLQPNRALRARALVVGAHSMGIVVQVLVPSFGTAQGEPFFVRRET